MKTLGSSCSIELAGELGQWGAMMGPDVFPKKKSAVPRFFLGGGGRGGEILVD